jgi:hypothetical protein
LDEEYDDVAEDIDNAALLGALKMAKLLIN